MPQNQLLGAPPPPPPPEVGAGGGGFVPPPDGVGVVPPLEPAVNAKVVTTPLGVTLRMAPLPLSATHRLRLPSTTRPRG